MSNSFLAIIPARGGSKRLAKKNVLDLNGKPLISWTIEAAKKSTYMQDILVSSDDKEILNIAKKQNVNILKRPEFLASDTASSFDAIVHAIENQNTQYEYIVLLQATSPLRNNKHIDEAIELLKSKNADAIISVCECEHSPLWTNTIQKDLDISNFLNDELLNKRSQDLDNYYRLNGAIYICKTKKLLKEKSFFLKKNIYAYIMPKEFSIDIDDKLDFIFAETLMKNNIE